MDSVRIVRPVARRAQATTCDSTTRIDRSPRIAATAKSAQTRARGRPTPTPRSPLTVPFGAGRNGVGPCGPTSPAPTPNWRRPEPGKTWTVRRFVATVRRADATVPAAQRDGLRMARAHPAVHVGPRMAQNRRSGRVQPRGSVRARRRRGAGADRGRRGRDPAHVRRAGRTRDPDRQRARRDRRAGRARRPVPPQLDRARRADAGLLQGAGRARERELALHGRGDRVPRRRCRSRAVLARRRCRCPNASNRSWRPVRPRATSARARATTTTSSTPAARPATRRAWCGARRTSSSARSAAGTPAARRSATPSRSCASVVDNPAQRLRAFLPPGDAGPEQYVALALGPLVHASGQWSALGTLLGGGKLVLYTDAHVDMARVLASDRTRARELAEPRRRRKRAPARRGVARRTRPVRHVVAAPARIGREHALRGREGRAAAAVAERARDRRGHRLVRVARASRVAHDARLDRTDLAHVRGQGRDDGRRRRSAPDPAGYRRGRPARDAWPRPARVLQGSGPQRARRSSRSTARAGRCPATWRPSTPTAPCTSSAAGRCASTPAARRSSPKRSRPSSSSHPRVADAVVLGAPDDRYGQHVVAIVAPHQSSVPETTRRVTLAALQDALPHAPRGLQAPACAACRRRGRAAPTPARSTTRGRAGCLGVRAAGRHVSVPSRRRRTGRASTTADAVGLLQRVICSSSSGNGSQPCVFSHTKSHCASAFS